MMEDNRLKRIAIVGGGTAGWMTAAALARILHGSGTEILLVESAEIPTVGVGEATIPPIRNFNRLLGIDEAEFIRETRGTYKLGIEFVDWTRLDHRYFHPFGVYGADINARYVHQQWLGLRAEGDQTPIDAYSLCTLAARAHRFAQQGVDPTQAQSTLTSAYHFDAGLYARFLRRYAERLGIARIEATVKSVSVHPETGFIAALDLGDDRKIEADFFIDCTGHFGLLIDRTLGVPFEDWSHWLPCDSAIAAPTANTDDLVPYTRSTARAAGWQWRIPLQHRVGNGYVFSSQYADDETARETFLRGLESEPVSEPRFLRFRTGRRQRFWEKNCVSIGLSSGFLEPLESTSIHLIQTGITKLLDYFPDRRFAPADIAEYNKLAAFEFDSIRDFIILHYCATERDDSPFWNHVRTMDIPESLRARIALFKSHGRVPLRTFDLFTDTSWVAVFLGQGIEPEGFEPLVANMPLGAVAAAMAQHRQRIESAVETLPRHTDYVASLVGAGVVST